jgi:alginate O-acetyltransferase complex protein AlgJ
MEMASTGNILSPAPPDSGRVEADRHPAIDRLFQCVLILLFLAGLGVPLVGTFLGWDPFEAFNEKRRLAAFPPWPSQYSQVRSYIPNVLSFYRDRFGFRDSLIHALMQVKVGVFHVSGSPEVIIGDNGWLFLRLRDDPNSFKFSPLAPLSEKELQDWQEMFERRQAWLASQHIAYLVLIAPEKQTIYPEFLSSELRRFQHNVRTDQLLDRLRETHSPVQILDVRPELLQAKQFQRVYWKADTHWSDIGAYVVYRALMAEIQRILPAKPLIVLQSADLTRVEAVGVGGDLANMLGVPEMFSETATTMTPTDQTLPPRNGTDQLYVLNGDPSGPRLVMYHDSFAHELIPLMARSFSHAAYFWGKRAIYPQFIAMQKPDLVIDEIAERFVSGEPTDDSDLPGQANPR